jgi:hypothetical protein
MAPEVTEEEAKQKVQAIPHEVKSAVSERIGLGTWKEMTWVQRLEAINTSAQGSETSKKGGEAKQKTSQQPAKVEEGPAEVHYDEMIKHNKKNDCWMAFHGKVRIWGILARLCPSHDLQFRVRPHAGKETPSGRLCGANSMSPAPSDANHPAMHLNLSSTHVLLACCWHGVCIWHARAMCFHYGMEREWKRRVACVDNMRF